MATKKRKPAIEKPEGFIDDIVVPVVKKVMRGQKQKKTLGKIASGLDKKSTKAGEKMYSKAQSKVDKGSYQRLLNSPTVTSRGIRKQAKKNWSYAEVADAIRAGKSTRGVARKTKKIAPKQVENPVYRSRKWG
jgi:hypothetical protein